jgi:NADPH-dependent 2,4-dienoyl-CoA reductase/sulfur reductase-like enzyme
MAIPYLLKAISTKPGTYLRKARGPFRAPCGIPGAPGRAGRFDAEQAEGAVRRRQFEHYDRLLIATGSHPVRAADRRHRPAPACTPAGPSPMRAPSPRCQAGARVLQLGAGFIGCIIMEALANAACKLTVVEMGDRMVPRMMTPEAGGMIKRWVELTWPGSRRE